MQNAIDGLKGKTAIVIGLGVSGCSAAHFFLENGVLVTGIDDNLEKIKNTPRLRELVDKGLVFAETSTIPPSADFVVASPGIPQSHPIIKLARENKCEVLGEIELACRYLSNRMLGVTGTNGKTTVTLLVSHVLNQSGISAHALGNSGTPLTDFLRSDRKTADDVLVVELSSYQLETLQARCLDAAVLLNITPDHLDRYGNMHEYASAKSRIGACLKNHTDLNCSSEIDQSPLYIHESCAREYPILGALTYGYHNENTIQTDLYQIFHLGTPLFSLPKRLQGKPSHDVENIMAAFALCQKIGITGAQFFKALETFNKPPHRIEFVRQHNGISYVNDSKGTNIDAVIKAVTSVDGKVILIAGGVDKGAAYTPWIEVFTEKVRCIIAIGQASKKIASDLDKHIPVRVCESLNAAVAAAHREAKPGETVLLSPGCSSYDMFKDYEHRGDEFKRIVQAL